MYREFVVTEAKKRHQRIADAGGDPAYSTYSPDSPAANGTFRIFVYRQVACSDYINTGMECP